MTGDWFAEKERLRFGVVAAFVAGDTSSFARLTRQLGAHLRLPREGSGSRPSRLEAAAARHRARWAALHTPGNVEFAETVRVARRVVRARGGDPVCDCLRGDVPRDYPRDARLERARQCARECPLREEIKRRVAAEESAR